MIGLQAIYIYICIAVEFGLDPTRHLAVASALEDRNYTCIPRYISMNMYNKGAKHS
jgi:hypothetical protein